METNNKRKKMVFILAVLGIAIICVIGVFAKKAYDRHQEELRLQAIETKNSEIDAEYQKFENEENRDKKLEALKQEVESAENYKKTENAYEECSAHYEKIIAQMKNSFVSEYDDTIKTIADKIGDDVEKVDDKEALKNAASEFTTFKDTLKNDFENYNTIVQDSFCLLYTSQRLTQSRESFMPIRRADFRRKSGFLFSRMNISMPDCSTRNGAMGVTSFCGTSPATTSSTTGCTKWRSAECRRMGCCMMKHFTTNRQKVSMLSLIHI